MAEIRRSFERRQRNLLAGIGAGAAATALIGAAVGAVTPELTTLGGTVLGALLGTGIGVLIGKRLGDRVLSELPEPLASERSYVGAHAPDDEAGTEADAGPTRSTLRPQPR